MMHPGSEFIYIQSTFTHMETALKRSTYMMMLMTKTFCNDDSMAELKRDACLMESIENPKKRWSDSHSLTQ